MFSASIPLFFFRLIHVIAVAGTMIDEIFWVRLKLESLIRVQMAMIGSKRTLNSNRAITAITWMSRKKNRGIDAENIEEFELRVSELEDKMSFFSQVFVTEKGKRNQMRLQIANSD